jgi:predicted ATP-grasp superfamily ATP-dependent carboligase
VGFWLEIGYKFSLAVVRETRSPPLVCFAWSQNMTAVFNLPRKQSSLLAHLHTTKTALSGLVFVKCGDGEIELPSERLKMMTLHDVSSLDFSMFE